MKIILASDTSFLLKYGYELTGIPKDQIKIGYIYTASKGARDKQFFIDVEEKIQNSGFNFVKYDIEEKSQKEIEDFFIDKNIIQVDGGNTFYLLNAIRNSGFNEFLRNEFNKEKVFIGTSAGAYVMCPTIEVADWNPSGKSRFGIIDFTALNYVPFVLKVYYTDDQQERIRGKMNELKYPLRILRDGQGIVVEDGNYNFVGDGEEVILN
jgi:dipeptidase E